MRQAPYEQGVILAVSIRNPNQPATSNRVPDCVHVFRVGRIGPEQRNEVVNAGTAFVLVFAVRRNAESLAHVLLMKAPQPGAGADTAEPLDLGRAPGWPFDEDSQQPSASFLFGAAADNISLDKISH